MNSRTNNYGSLDAETSQSIRHSRIWTIEILEKRLKKNETILDTGNRTGRVTKIIAKKVNRGKVYAADIDDNMIANAKELDFQKLYLSNQA